MTNTGRLLTMVEMSRAIVEHRRILELNGRSPNMQDDRYALCQAQDAKTHRIDEQAILNKVSESGVRIELTSHSDKPTVDFDDGDSVHQTGALVEFLMHLSILMPNCELPDDLTIIPTKVLHGKMPEEVKHD